MIHLSPDGLHYLRAARGAPVPHPYRLRWLAPWSVGPCPKRWAAWTWLALATTPYAAWGYFGAMGLGGRERLFASALLCVLPGVWRCSLRFPVLLDAVSYQVALALACHAASGAPWWLTIPLALLGGATRETVPIFAALWSWSPLPLVGIVACGWWRPAAPPSPNEPWLAHPVRYALALRRQIGLDSGLYLRPWGAALIGLTAPTWQLAATVAVAHAQLFAAVDTIRLVVWCAPVLVLAAAPRIPVEWWTLALLFTLVQKDERA